MKGTVALVTGASSGIGEATARALHERGCVVYGAARRVERMTALAESGVRVLAMDVTDDASMVAGVATILREQGHIDILINNAGYGSYGSLEDVSIDEGRYQVEVNVMGMARLAQLVIPGMRERRSGRIINVSSVFGKMWGPLGVWYHATKYAVEGLSDALRLELRPFGIHTIIIEPGAIKTEWGQIAIDKLLQVSGETAYSAQAHAVAHSLSTIMEKMAVQPQVIADAVVKAATTRSPRARYVAPAMMRVPLFAMRFLPDCALDRIMMGVFGTMKTTSTPAGTTTPAESGPAR